ncbi:MAG: hypothetical protein SNJ62_06140, partial [Chloracidobacterium sp.]
ATPSALVPASAAKPGLVRRVWSSFRQSGLKKAYETFVTRKVILRSIEYGGIGIIAAVAPRSGFRVGQRVAWVGYGQDLPAPMVFVSAARLISVPDHTPDDLALLALPGGMAWRAVEAADLRLGLPVGVGGQNPVGLLSRGLCRLSGGDLHDLDATPQPDWRLAALIVTSLAIAERIAPQLSHIALPQARLVASLPTLPAAVWSHCRAQEMQVRFTWVGGGGEQDPLATAASPLPAMEAFLRLADDLPRDGRPAIEGHDFDAIDAAVDAAFRADAPPGQVVVVNYPTSVEAHPVTRFDVGGARPKLAGTVGLALVTDTSDETLSDIIPAKQVRLTGLVAGHPETAKRLAQTFDSEYGTNDVSPLLSDGRTDAVLMGGAADGLRFAGDILRGRLPLFLTTLPTEDESELETLFQLAMTHDAPLMINFARLATPAFAELKKLRTNATPSWMQYDFQDTRPMPSADATFRLAEAILMAMVFTGSIPERLYAQEVNQERLTTLAVMLALSDGSSAQISASFGAERQQERLSARTTAGQIEREDVTPSLASQRTYFENFLKQLAAGETPTPTTTQIQQAIRTALRIRDSLAFGTVIGLSASN